MGTSPLIVRRDRQGQNLHDTVISFLARHWHNPSKYNIATNPGPEKNRWVGSEQNYPDIVGWVQDISSQRAVWIAEVETSGSVTDDEARHQWAKYLSTGVALHLVVPAGYGRAAKALAIKLKLAVAGFYEFSFSNGQLVLGQV